MSPDDMFLWNVGERLMNSVVSLNSSFNRNSVYQALFYPIQEAGNEATAWCLCICEVMSCCSVVFFIQLEMTCVATCLIVISAKRVHVVYPQIWKNVMRVCSAYVHMNPLHTYIINLHTYHMISSTFVTSLFVQSWNGFVPMAQISYSRTP